MIYDDYILYCDQYTQKYGPKTVVFMQVGDFFELYAVQNETERAGADIYRVTELCNIQVSRKNKSILENSRQNPLMAGFPIATISKFIQIMVQNDYTCVLIRQTTPPPNPKREVTEIISPATTLTIQTPQSNTLMTIYWETIPDHTTQKKHLSFGLALLDVTTGKSHTYEAYSTTADPNYALDEAYRLFCHYKPAELVFLADTLDPNTQEQLTQTYMVSTALHTFWNPKDFHPYKQPAYQNSVLEKVFGKTFLTPIENLHLERTPLATLAYTYAIQFAYEHNETIVQKIEKPHTLTNNNHLVLEANSAYQLNVLSHTHERTLLEILNQTKTAFGSRLFKERLLHPILSIEALEERYQQIEYFKNYYSQLTPLLASILDLERILRKIALQRLQPCEWTSLHTSLETTLQIYQRLNKPIAPLQTILTAYQSTLNLEECAKYNLQDIYTSLFQKNYSPSLDQLQNNLQSHQQALQAIANSLDPTLCRLDCNERDGYYISTTKKRWETLKQPSYTAKPISATSTTLRITSPTIEKHSNQMLLLQRQISLLNIELYKQFLTTFYETHAQSLQTIIADLAIIDVTCANARNAIEYNYQRPTLVSNHPTSFFKAKELRHPIIERLSNNTSYVTNDITLDQSGTLLYGINASGKSSLMKAIGLTVIMAQAGMYVPAMLELSPYKHLFTRIATMDNIWRGLSTFTVEMLELKNILHRCDQYSLVLGDELCAGTEAVSGIAIVAAGIHALQEKQTSFVFATHLHELLDVDLPTITVQHMHIEVDPQGTILYDRKLKPGPGSPLYGLEVCRFLQMPDNFLQKANAIRKKIQNIPPHLVAQKTSRYNSNLYVSTCELCGKEATETHHIHHQKDATSLLVHHSSNLVTLCEACHLKQHTQKEVIHSKIQTSQGVQLQIVPQNHSHPSPTKSKDLQDVLLYQIKGWFYRLNTTEKWRKITPTTFTRLAKLGYEVPTDPTRIPSFLEELQGKLGYNL